MDKLFSKAKSTLTSNINIAISNGMNFTVQVLPLADAEGNFPPNSDVFEFTEAYVKDTMKYRQLNEKALAGMKKKWEKTHGPDVPFLPKKQASELVVILIAPSDEVIHLFYSVPKTIEYKPMHSTDQWEYENRNVHYSEISEPADSTIFKYRDELMREIIQDLKVQGVYVDDEDDDEEVYNLDDIEDDS